MPATENLSESEVLFVSGLRVSWLRVPRVYSFEIVRIAEVLARLIEPLFQAKSLRCKLRIVSEVSGFIAVVAQIKELRVFFGGSIVFDQLSALVTNHSLTIAISSEETVADSLTLAVHHRQEALSFNFRRRLHTREVTDRRKQVGHFSQIKYTEFRSR